MTDKTRENILRDGMEFIDSLHNAIREAGGSGFTIKELQSMSFMEFANKICTNNIRFIFIDPTKEES